MIKRKKIEEIHSSAHLGEEKFWSVEIILVNNEYIYIWILIITFIWLPNSIYELFNSKVSATLFWWLCKISFFEKFTQFWFQPAHTYTHPQTYINTHKHTHTHIYIYIKIGLGRSLVKTTGFTSNGYTICVTLAYTTRQYTANRSRALGGKMQPRAHRRRRRALPTALSLTEGWFYTGNFSQGEFFRLSGPDSCKAIEFLWMVISCPEANF